MTNKNASGNIVHLLHYKDASTQLSMRQNKSNLTLPSRLSSLTCSLQKIAAVSLGQHHQVECQDSFWNRVARDVLFIKLTMSQH